MGKDNQAWEAVGRIQRLLFLKIVGVRIGGGRLERERAAHHFVEKPRRGHVVVRHGSVVLQRPSKSGRESRRVQIVAVLCIFGTVVGNSPGRDYCLGLIQKTYGVIDIAASYSCF